MLARLDLNSGALAISHMTLSFAHLFQLSKQNIPATTLSALSNTLSPTRQTFSSTDSPSIALSCLSHHSLHISAESPSPYECGQPVYCIALSRIPASLALLSEKVCPDILSRQDSGCGVDISVSTQYDIASDIPRDQKIDSPCPQYIISTPPHSPTGTARGTLPSGLLENRIVGDLFSLAKKCPCPANTQSNVNDFRFIVND